MNLYEFVDNWRFLWKVQSFLVTKIFVSLQLYQKETPTQVFFCECCKILRTAVLKNICQRLLLSYHQALFTLLLWWSTSKICFSKTVSSLLLLITAFFMTLSIMYSWSSYIHKSLYIFSVYFLPSLSFLRSYTRVKLLILLF